MMGTHDRMIADLSVAAAAERHKEIWRLNKDWPLSDHAFVTSDDGQAALGIAIGGFVIIKPIKEWHRLAREDDLATLTVRVERLEDAIRELNPGLNL